MSTLLEQLEYGFDRDSRRSWRRRVLATGQDDAYGYDGLSQVVNAARGNLNLNATAIGGVPAEDESWDYDPTGNWRGYRLEENGAVTLEQRRVHDKGNRLMQVEGSAGAVLVDRAGRMTQVPPDAAGEWNQEQRMVWDAWSRLVAVADDVQGLTGSYSYDGLNRRMTRVVNGVTWHTYYSDAWRPLEERQDDQTTAARQYYWGARHRDDLVRRDRATTSGGSLDETRYVLMDYFSPAAITDESGVVTERYAFSAFGVRSIMAPDFSPRATSECEWEFGFQGQFLDTESGFYDYGYRYYSPNLGRWLSKDPIGEEGGVNLYGFAENNGVNSVDYLGLQSWAPIVGRNGEWLAPFGMPKPTPMAPDPLSTGKFIRWYFNNKGVEYDIVAQGELELLKKALVPELRDIDDAAWKAIKAKAADSCPAKGPNAPNTPMTFPYSNRGNKVFADLTKRIFWIGKTTLFWGLEGKITVNCCLKVYKYDGNLKYSLRDAGADPLDIGIELPGGTPYKIIADWEKIYPASGVFD